MQKCIQIHDVQLLFRVMQFYVVDWQWRNLDMTREAMAPKKFYRYAILCVWQAMAKLVHVLRYKVFYRC